MSSSEPGEEGRGFFVVGAACAKALGWKEQGKLKEMKTIQYGFSLGCMEKQQSQGSGGT